jgi:hypothetical protein
MIEVDKLTTKELLELAKSDTLLSRVRGLFSNEWATLEQAGMQRNMPTPIEVLRMEFRSSIKIAKLLGVDLTAENDVESS